MGKKKILLIDDEKNLCKLLSLFIEDWGFDIIVAHDGKDGLAKAKKESPDLIILDLMLPALPGEEVCRQIRKDEKIEKTPIIMLTAKTADVDRVIGKVIGADCYLEKPFNIEELLKEINKRL